MPESEHLILNALRVSQSPVSLKALAKTAKAGEAELRAALESAMAAGAVFRWPDYRRAQYFWHISPEEKTRGALLSAASEQALSKAELCKAAAKSLRGIPGKRIEAICAAMVSAKQLQAVPGFSAGARLLIAPGGETAYLKAARLFIEKKIRAAGFDPPALFASPPPPIQHDASPLILEAVTRLEPVRGVPVSTLRLRNELPSLTKPEFDAGALDLRRRQAVFLSLHADPYNLSREDRDLLIDGQDGTYYVAIALR